jgi:serine protease inhibitor ecotin
VSVEALEKILLPLHETNDKGEVNIEGVQYVCITQKTLSNHTTLRLDTVNSRLKHRMKDAVWKNANCILSGSLFKGTRVNLYRLDQIQDLLSQEIATPKEKVEKKKVPIIRAGETIEIGDIEYIALTSSLSP